MNACSSILASAHFECQLLEANERVGAGGGGAQFNGPNESRIFRKKAKRQRKARTRQLKVEQQMRVDWEMRRPAKMELAPRKQPP
jgi:hypothetical protein